MENIDPEPEIIEEKVKIIPKRKYNPKNLVKGQESLKAIIKEAKEIYNHPDNKDKTWKATISECAKKRKQNPNNII